MNRTLTRQFHICYTIERTSYFMFCRQFIAQLFGTFQGKYLI
ncbi:hypothetical protein HanXRQr2_Chr10g0451851 [Helianthus annuus]|uniref:Uncharacterized protein n=1 Tax=Helianthus annuus TaxID=4232 RepID=A0A9K3HZQ8_HELAN|nr:hypothetical protein HanXRQr2_Chr10g0451851 [Helianthus annuus]